MTKFKDMDGYKKADILLWSLVIACGIGLSVMGCNHNVNKERELNEFLYGETDTVYVTDTVIVDNTNYILVDSLQEELFVAKYKLERVRYYNDIAKNGNNIKFLRGWINRVLTEE